MPRSASSWGNDDDLIEEYSGYRFRAENRKAGTERLGASLEFSRFTQEWHGATLLALESRPDIPQIYDTRITCGARGDVRIHPTAEVERRRECVRAGAVHAGWRLRSMQTPLWPRSGTTRGAAARDDSQLIREGSARQDVATLRRYEFRAGTDALDSNLIYDRHFGRARYQAGRGRSTFIADSATGPDHGPGAALRAILARRLVDASRLEQVRHRASRRGPHVAPVDRVPLPRDRVLLRRRLGLGRGCRTASTVRHRVRHSHRARVPDGGLSAERR